MTRRRAKAPSQRQLRIGEELRHALATVLARGDLHDPDLRDVPITVTEVRPSANLRQATVYVMPLGGGEADSIVEALARARPYLQNQVAAQTALRFMPQLQFKVDRSFDTAEQVDDLLRRADRGERGGP